MKATIKSLCLLLVILSGFAFSSCSEDDAGKLLIVGTWRMDKVDYYLTEYGDTHEVRTLDLSGYNFVTKFKTDGTFKYCAVEINPDGMITNESDTYLEGIWDYSNGVITLSSYSDEEYDIMELDETNLVMQIIKEDKENETEHKYIHYMTRISELFQE
jgi:hypothetical protein